MNVLIIFFISCVLWSSVDLMNEAESYQNCLDHKGKEVSHGDRFFPLGSDPCTQCTCLNGKPQMCISVFCSPPENCKQYHALSDKCCEFVCLDRDFPNKASGNGTYPDTDSLSTTNLGLRLVASTVTSFLILALLLFMIHRLRQRRLLLMIRRFHARRMDSGNAHLSRRFSEDEDGSVGYFVGHDQLDFSRYDEPPPPYTLWKPPEMYIPPGEAPPPYDLSVQLTAPYSNSECFRYAPAEQVELQHQAVISVHVENQESTSQNHSPTEPTVTSSAETFPVANCSICTAVDMELNNMANSTSGTVLPPDIQYEESGSYLQTSSTSNTTQLETTESAQKEEIDHTSVPSTSAACNDNVVLTTNSCTCSTINSKRGRSKRHSLADSAENNVLRNSLPKNEDKCVSAYPSNFNQENNNLYPDPTVWCGEASESSSSSSPTYDQPTLSPSTSDSSSPDVDFIKVSRSKQTRASAQTVPNKNASVSREPVYENTCCLKDMPEDSSKAPNFQKTLSNLKKFSLIKRKKKKRRMERPNEFSCSFVCQAIPDNLHTAHQTMFEDGIDLTSRNTNENISHPLEAINPHIGHKLASSSLKSQARPSSINLLERQLEGARYIAYGKFPCCSSATTNMEGSACCNSSSPDSLCESQRIQSEVHTIRSLNRQGISRSGSICSETGERRYHWSAGSSPTTSRSNHLLEDCSRLSDVRYASSSHLTTSDRTISNRYGQASEDRTKHIPVWIINPVATRREYDTRNGHSFAMRRSASGCFGESSRSVGDISPLDFRDSVLSSGSSWEACSHL